MTIRCSPLRRFRKWISVSALAASALCASGAARAATLTFNFLQDPVVVNNLILDSSSHLALINNPTPPNPPLPSTGVGHGFFAAGDDPAHPVDFIYATAETYSNLNFINDIHNNPVGLPDLTHSPSLTHAVGTNLTVKYNNTTGESGLGMRPDPNFNNEINRSSSIAIDFLPLETQLGLANVTGIQFVIGSAQANEGYALYGSNNPFLDSSAMLIQNDAGGDGSPNSDILNPTALTIPVIDAYRFFIVTSYGSGNYYKPNILLNDVIVSTTDIIHHNVATPEPGSMVVWSLVGCFVLAGSRYRRRAAARI